MISKHMEDLMGPDGVKQTIQMFVYIDILEMFLKFYENTVPDERGPTIDWRDHKPEWMRSDQPCRTEES